jgi:hypothetical protein
MAGSTFDVTGLVAVKAVLNTIAKEDLNEARKEIRTASKAIAEKHLIPALKRSAGSSGVPIASRMADTSRARSDRIVFVAIGAVNPKLSGFKRGQSKYRTGMAWGSERGPVPDARVNNYAVPFRGDRGYWVRSATEATGPKAAEEYTAMLHRVMRKYGGR